MQINDYQNETHKTDEYIPTIEAMQKIVDKLDNVLSFEIKMGSVVFEVKPYTQKLPLLGISRKVSCIIFPLWGVADNIPSKYIQNIILEIEKMTGVENAN